MARVAADSSDNRGLKRCAASRCCNFNREREVSAADQASTMRGNLA